MTTDLVTVVVTGILSGGLGVGGGTLIKARSESRNTDAATVGVIAKLPAEVDSVIVQGAEAAVLTMRSALESAQGRIGQLEAERAADQLRIADLERRVAEYREKVERAELALSEAREAGAELRRELASFARERDGRR